MVKLTDKDKLIQDINEIFGKLRHKRHHLNLFKDEVSKYGITGGEIQKILIGKVSLEDMDTLDLCRILIGLNEMDPQYSRSPYFYFSDDKIMEARSSERRVIDANEDMFPLTISGEVVDSKTFKSHISTDILINLYNNNFIQYNFDISKQYRYESNNIGQTIKVLDIDNYLIKKLTEDLEQGKFDYKIVISLSSEERETFNEEKIVITEFSNLFVIVGLHILITLSHAKSIGIEIPPTIETEIVICSLEEMKQYYHENIIRGEII
ncbi:hypothetical protein M5X17_27995 [Paenibacillus alvei]|uniref:hypothetical protein n=1 Tax=Paenibacillus alvei TaxID=44250 RepID=UPI00228196C1|nr:hypothetical protein [Paenibacillus alvei]MCY9737550.1 hypothetical protein [Paenibacillus alvei]